MKKHSLLFAAMIILLGSGLSSCSKKMGCYYSELNGDRSARQILTNLNKEQMQESTVRTDHTTWSVVKNAR